MQPGQRHLGGRHHPQVFLVVVVQVVAELGQLPGAEQGLRLDHEGGVLLGVALADVQVEHPGDQGALQARPGPAEHVEARTGDLDALLKVEDAQRRAQIPVRLGLEVKFGQLAHRAQDDVLAVILAIGRARVGDIGDACQDLVQRFLDLAQLFITG